MRDPRAHAGVALEEPVHAVLVARQDHHQLVPVVLHHLEQDITLNHTALTLEALSTRRLAVAGVVIGAWPAEPGLAERANLTDLPVIAGQPLAGAIAAGAARLSRDDFLAAARAGLGPALGGTYHGGTN